MQDFGTQIILLESEIGGCVIDDEFRDEFGALSICIPDSVTLNYNYKQKDISELDQLISDYSDSFEFYPENRTLLLLNYIHNKRSYNGEQRLRAVALVEGINLIDGYVTVTETNEVGISGMVKYKIQIIGTHQTWKDRAKQLMLCDIDLGQYTWGVSEVLATMQGAAMQIDTQPSVYPWLANFGEWEAGSEVSLGDLRLLIYSRAIFIGGFCALGYEVVSKFINSEYYRRNGEYVLKPDYYNYPNKGQDFRARFQLNSNQVIPVVGSPVQVREIIKYDNDYSPPNEDPGNNYDTVTWRYTNNTLDIINVELTIETTVLFSLLGLVRAFRIELDSFVQGNFTTDVINSGALTALETQRTVSFTTSCVALDPGDWFEVYAVTVNFDDTINPPIPPDPITIIAGSNVTVNACSNIIHPGDTFDVNDMVRCDISFYDWLNDNAKMFNLRFLTQESRKRIYTEPFPGRYEMYQQYLQTGSITENKIYRGFEGVPEDDRSVSDFTNSIDICEAITKRFTAPKLPVSYQFRFKNDSNEKFDFINDFTDQSPPFSKTVQVTGGTENQTNIALSLTAVTFNDFDPNIIPVPGGRAPYIPFLWNTERLTGGGYPPKGYAYDRRVVYIHGWVHQSEASGSEQATWIFEGNVYDRVPTTAMSYPYFISTFNADIHPDANVIFGDSGVAKDLVTTFYSESIFSETVEIEHVLTLNLSNLQVLNFNPSMLLLIKFDDSAMQRFNGYYRVDSISKPLNKIGKTTMVVRLKAPFTC